MKKLFVTLLLFSGFTTWAVTDKNVTDLVHRTAEDVQKDAPGTFGKIKKGEAPYKKGKLYAFAYDMDLNMVAHPNTALVGLNLKGKGDVCGCNFRDEILNRVKNHSGRTGCKGGNKEWVHYVYKNPENNKLEHKKSYFKSVKGSDGKDYIIISGNYINAWTSCEK